MGTSNFDSMRDFPLIVAEDVMCKVCPECHIGGLDENAKKCEECGADLSKVEPTYDGFYMSDLYDEMERIAENLNETDVQPFHFYNVIVKSGYYSGIQFYVEELYEDITKDEWDEEDAQYEFGMSLDEAISAQNKAHDAICNGLIKAKDELGLIELGVTGRFSNGETIYHKI